VENLLIQSIGLRQQNAGGPGTCFLNIYNAARVRLIQDYISGPPNSGTIALYLQNNAQVEIRQNTFEDYAFGQDILVPNTTNNYMAALTINNNRFGPLAFAYRYNYEVDLEILTNGASFGCKAVDISNNVFELGPNYLKIVDGVGVSVTDNWTGDGLNLDKWYANTAKKSNTCVTPTNYTGTSRGPGTPYVFCTSAAGMTASTEPSWNTVPGNVAVGIQLEPNSALAPAAFGSTTVFGNNIFGALWTGLWDLG
jgi:hypothetical protein